MGYSKNASRTRLKSVGKGKGRRGRNKRKEKQRWKKREFVKNILATVNWPRLKAKRMNLEGQARRVSVRKQELKRAGVIKNNVTI